MKKISNLLMMALLTIGMGLTSCEGALDDILGEWSRPTPGSSTGGAVTSIGLDADMKLAVGDKGQLTAKVDPAGTAVTWSSDKEEIATVDANGLVTAVAVGTAIITAKAGDKTATCEVTVTPGLSTPLTVEAITAGTIKVTSPQPGMNYSTDGGVTKKIILGDVNISVAAGDKVAFYGTATYYNGTKISGADDSGTFKCKVYGNIMSLLYEDFATNTNTTLPDENTFYRLFYGNTKLTDASGLLLPAKTLTNNCYFSMFEGCSALTAAPAELPAETLTYGCYQQMFNGCTALTTAPKLPAMALADHCYEQMFEGCKALTETPKLPAQELKVNCYYGMFRNCTSLTTAYVKANYKNTTSYHECEQMFAGCTNAATSTFYSDYAANWKSNFSASLSSWQTAAYPTE